MFAFLYALLMATVVASVVYLLTRQVHLALALAFLFVVGLFLMAFLTRHGV